ncbi:MAG: glycosyltransferase [Patescibacteria group bacterium]
MKVAFIGQKGIPTKQGGIEKHVEELSTRLAQAGFDVTVYSRPHYTGQKQKVYFYKKVQIINLPSLVTKHLDAISHTFLASLHALFQNYNVIHYHGVGPSLMSFIPRIFNPRAKVIVTFHCIDRQHQKWGIFAKTMLGLGEWTACHFPHETIVVSQTLQNIAATALIARPLTCPMASGPTPVGKTPKFFPS